MPAPVWSPKVKGFSILAQSWRFPSCALTFRLPHWFASSRVGSRSEGAPSDELVHAETTLAHKSWVFSPMASKL